MKWYEGIYVIYAIPIACYKGIEFAIKDIINEIKKPLAFKCISCEHPIEVSNATQKKLR